MRRFKVQLVETPPSGLASQMAVVDAIGGLIKAAVSGALDKQEIDKAMQVLGDRMESVLKENPEHDCGATLRHIFADGLYGREWTCKKGNFIVTEKWLEQNISSLIKGKVAVVSCDGFQQIEAPAFFVTEPGTQRFMLILEDTVFTTVHPNPDNERDVNALLERMTTVHNIHRERNEMVL